MTLKLRAKVNFPATVTATGGLQVVKQNGIWTVSPKWDDLTLETVIPDPEARELWTRDPSTATYYRLSVQALIDNLPEGPPGEDGEDGAPGATGPAAWLPPAAWLTATAYVAGPPASVVTQGGETYVCLISHTSGVFATDLGAGKWIKVSAKGADGAGTGDMLAANNLSDVSDKKASKDNISIHGSDVASASTVNLETATGDLIDVTGTTAITAVTLSEGHERTVRFTGILTLTNGASLILPGGANITTAAGDYAIFRGYGSSVVRCVDYVKKSGKPVIGPASTDILDSTSTGRALITAADAGTAIRGLGGIDFSAVVSLTTTATLTSSAFGKLHVISGTSAAYTVTLPTPVGNGGAVMGFQVDLPAAASKLYTLSTPSGVIGKQGASFIMWASETVFLRSDGTNWAVIDGRPQAFAGRFVKTTNQTGFNTTYANVTFTAAQEDPTSLNLAYVSSIFQAPRKGVYHFTAYVYATQTGGAYLQSQFSGSTNALNCLGAVTAGTMLNFETFSLAANDTKSIQIHGDGTSLTAAGATVASSLTYMEIPSW